VIDIEWLPFQRARSYISAPCFFSILKVLPESRSSIGAKTPVVRRGLVVYDLTLSATSGTLIGRFLPRMLLHARGVALADMKFSATEAGKPFIASRSSA
jgi:hypothetical protein